MRDEDINNLFYELGVILKAGVPVMRDLRMVIDETDKEAMKKLLEGAAAAKIYDFGA